MTVTLADGATVRCRPVFDLVKEYAAHFDPKTTERTVRLGLSDATESWLLPPLLRAHEQRLARERYYSKQKFADPEATIRRRGGGRRPPQRRRRR